jgi:hypothetical protein
MGLRPVLIVLAALALTGCASAEYAYCYDPYRGPVGYYTGPLDPKPACATQSPQAAHFAGPHEAGYRGAFISGPHPGPVTPAAVDAARPAVAR